MTFPGRAWIRVRDVMFMQITHHFWTRRPGFWSDSQGLVDYSQMLVPVPPTVSSLAWAGTLVHLGGWSCALDSMHGRSPAS